MYWQGTLEESNGEVVGRSAGPAPIAPTARRVMSFYEKELPGFFGSVRGPASAATTSVSGTGIPTPVVRPHSTPPAPWPRKLV